MIRVAFVALSLVFSGALAQAQTPDAAARARADSEVEGLWKDSSDRPITMKLTSGHCSRYFAAGALSILVGAPQDFIEAVAKMKERDVARLAAEYACHRKGGDPVVSDQVAVRLVQIGQCHNVSAIEFIEHNQNYIRDALGPRGGCR